jgi:phospholipid/cholesterol/gamma-HCH transport system substrate-binding protein
VSPRVRRQLVPLGAIIAMAVVAAAVGAYILANQRLRFPLIEPEPFTLKAELSTAQAVTPGQGQTVQVSGVRIGDIGQVELRGGRAIVRLEIDDEYRDLVRTDATALLRPKTGLKDMLLELDPGTDAAPVAREGWTIPVSNTLPDVNVDEIDQMLDADTRAYVQHLIGGAGAGLRGNGTMLREVLRRFEPTAHDVDRVAGRVARRHAALRRLVRSLRRISDELAGRDDEIARMVRASATALGAIAQEDDAVSRGVRRLPEALGETRVALGRVQALAEELGPAATALRPVVRELGPAAESVGELARDAPPVLRGSLRPFAREARPLARELTGPALDLERAVPSVRRVVSMANRALNMLAYNRDGREGVDDRDRDEGFLFWLAWATHNGVEIFRVGDAHGPFYALTQQSHCASFQGLAENLGQGDPLLGTALGGLQGVFTDPRVCGTSATSGSGATARRLRGGRLDRTPARPAAGRGR